MSEIYISTDIETDGPIPAVNSMLSIGSAAFTAEKKLVDTFYANIYPLAGAVSDPDTMRWWGENREAYQATQVNQETAYDAMNRYTQWLRKFKERPVFVGYPAGFDFTFVYWYLMKFVGASPFSFSAIDIKTYAMAMLKDEYRKLGKKDFPSAWFDKTTKHTHHALDDAIEQGALFCNMLAQNLGKQRNEDIASSISVVDKRSSKA